MAFGTLPVKARILLLPFRIYNDEIAIVGTMAVLFSFHAAHDLISGGAINTEAMLTIAFPMEDFSTALDMMRHAEGVKTQVLPNGE